MRLMLCAATAVLLSSTAFAQIPLAGGRVSHTTAQATDATTVSTTMKTPKAAPKPRTAASLQCSKDADAKNVHGKPRKAFMSQCKKAAGKG